MGFRTQPHDQFETSRDLTALGVRLFAGQIAPVMAWRKLRMMTHQEQYLTSRGPMKVLFDRAREMEHDRRVLTVSPFPMQCWLDADEAGWSVVAVTDGDPELAERLVDELADLAWSMRTDFQQTESVAVDDAVRRADDVASGTILLSDTGDSVLGGSGGDSTVILDAILRAGIRGRAAVPMIDARAAVHLAEAGAGATVTLSLGGRSTPLFTPLPVTGVVRAVGDGAGGCPRSPSGAHQHGPLRRLRRRAGHVAGDRARRCRRNPPGRLSARRRRAGRSPDGRDEDRIELPVHGAAHLRSDPSGDARPHPIRPHGPAVAARAPWPIFPLDQPATWHG